MPRRNNHREYQHLNGDKMLQKIKKDALECVKPKPKRRVTRYQADVKGDY